jgi:hypothetical protein
MRALIQAIMIGAMALMGTQHAVAQPPPVAAGPAEQLGAPVSTSFTSKIGFFDADPVPGASYPRVIQLKYFAGGKGQLLATFARRGTMPIYRSTDNGETWQNFSEVSNLRGQPALYELPQKMGEFPAGTIMAAGLGGAEPGKMTLEVSVSRDGGKTWHYLSTIAVGGSGRYDPADRAGLSLNQSPVYEPYLYTDAAGRLIAYFSDERDKKDGYSQLLDHRVSPDGGKSWGDLVYDVAIADGLSRPGMPIVTRDGAGKFYMSYEVVGMPGHALEPRSNLTHFRTSSDGDGWGDPKDYGTLIQDRWRQYPNGTPYIAWSPWGGANGTLVASGRSVMRYDLGLIGNGVMINRNNGEGLWTLIETPIVYNPALDGYSQTMIPLGDGREILQFVSVNNRIAYAKFRLPEKLPQYAFPWGGAKTTDARRSED